MTPLLEWLIEGSAVALFATLVAWCIPVGYPRQRLALWWLALLSVFALPLAAILPAPTLGVAAVVAAQADPVGAFTIPPLPFWVTGLAIAVWLAVATYSLARLAASVVAVRRLALRAQPLAPDVEARLRQFARARAGSRAVQLFVSDGISGACALGFRRPRILIATALVDRLDRDALEAIVLHEYAHLQRYDDATYLMQRVLVALAGLHPAVRWISRQIDVEREAACDRLVVERTAAPARYARALTQVGEIALAVGQRTALGAPGALASRPGLHGRVVRLLTETRVTTRVANAALVVGSVSLVTGTAAVGAMPPLVGTASIEASMVTFAEQRMLVADTSAGPLTAVGLPLGLPSLDAAPAMPHGQEVTASPAGSLTAAGSALQPYGVAGQPATPPRVSPEGDDPSVMIVDDREATPAADRVLSSAPVTQVAPVSPLVAAPLSAAPTPGWSAAGAAAARTGVSAGDAASRAGRSLGRAFKNGGLAVAGRF